MHLQSVAAILTFSAAAVGHAAGESACLFQKQRSPALPELPALPDLPVFNATRDRVLIFTDAKTGSTSLQVSLEHLLGGLPPFVNSLMSKYPPHMKTHNGHIAEDFLKKLPQPSTVWIVKSVRSVFERAISKYFQEICKTTCLACKACVMKPDVESIEAVEFGESSKSIVRELLDDFDALCSIWLTNTGTMVQRFKNFTGVDIVPSQFDHAEGRLVVESSAGDLKINTVIVRLEDVRRWPSIMRPMFPGYENKSKNLASKKWYTNIYDQFKASFYASMTDTYDLDYDEMRFYTPEELQAFKTNADAATGNLSE